MPVFTKHEPGTFSWADLSTSDVDAAISLYTELFGWEVEKEDLPDGGVYAMARVGGKDAAAISPLQPQQAEMGVPPHWNVYVTVEDAEQAAKECEAAGGSIHAPAFDVMDYGRMAVISDPTGAFFCVWEPKKTIGAQVLGDKNTLGWCELLTGEPEKAVNFYCEVFGYGQQPFGDTGYTVLTRGETQIAGVMKPPMEMPSNWGVYFITDDVDGAAAKTKAAGGQAFMEPTDMPEIGRLAVLADPQGAAFGVITGSMDS